MVPYNFYKFMTPFKENVKVCSKYKSQIALAQISFRIIIQHLPFYVISVLILKRAIFLIPLHLFSNTYIYYCNYCLQVYLAQKSVSDFPISHQLQFKRNLECEPMQYFKDKML